VSRVAVLLHGAGSCPETVERLLGPAVPPAAQVRSPAWRGSVETAVGALERELAELERAGDDLVLVGGVSLGAHAAALWAARTRSTTPLALAMPAWTGAPDAVAGATLAAADDVAARGAAGVLAGIAADPATEGDWVLDELACGWAGYDDEALVRSLREAAASSAPDAQDLALVRGPAAVVALADDPLHPEQVAQLWAARIAHARLTVVARHAPHDDRGALGRAAAQSLGELSGSR